jgi:pimeloyl-ACP methyl ester carboxylesterase
MLGHETLGTGPTTVIVMNDWLCDTSTWDDARAYLDGARFTWVFADLRGYGRSKLRLSSGLLARTIAAMAAGPPTPLAIASGGEAAGGFAQHARPHAPSADSQAKCRLTTTRIEVGSSTLPCSIAIRSVLERARSAPCG